MHACVQDMVSVHIEIGPAYQEKDKAINNLDEMTMRTLVRVSV